MAIKIVPYSKEIVKDYVYNGVENNLMPKNIIPVIEYYASIGKVYVGIIDNKVIGFGGIYPLWERTGGCFLSLNKEAKDNKREVYCAILDYMKVLFEYYKFDNLIVECLNENPEAIRLIEHLGFKKDKDIKVTTYIREV